MNELFISIRSVLFMVHYVHQMKEKDIDVIVRWFSSMCQMNWKNANRKCVDSKVDLFTFYLQMQATNILISESDHEVFH